MKRKFNLGQIVTTSKCSFLQNRLSDSCTVVGHLPQAVDGFSYRTQSNIDVPELVTLEGDLSLVATWEM
jgi:hypothetical protein